MTYAYFFCFKKQIFVNWLYPLKCAFPHEKSKHLALKDC